MLQKAYLCLAVVLCAPFGAAVALADPDPRCLRNFKVKPGLVLSGDAVGLECGEVELIRESAYGEILRLRASDGDEQYKELLATAEKARRLYEKAQADEDWSQFAAGASLIGNTVTVIGLAACAETLGLGCAAASIGYVTAKIGIIASASDLVDKKAAVKALRERLVEDTARLRDSREKLDASLEAALVDFAELCRVVQEECVEPED